MREIKFRAWSNRTHKMCDVLNIFFEGQQVSLTEKPNVTNTHAMSLVELMEFTGLRDRKRTEEYPNGQPIYEDDIVRCETGAQTVTGVVEYDIYECLWHIGKNPLQYFVFNSQTPEQMEVYIEVIGNIYENPELLEPANA